jgi:hypothetical protein
MQSQGKVVAGNNGEKEERYSLRNYSKKNNFRRLDLSDGRKRFFRRPPSANGRYIFFSVGSADGRQATQLGACTTYSPGQPAYPPPPPRPRSPSAGAGAALVDIRPGHRAPDTPLSVLRGQRGASPSATVRPTSAPLQRPPHGRCRCLSAGHHASPPDLLARPRPAALPVRLGRSSPRTRPLRARPAAPICSSAVVNRAQVVLARVVLCNCMCGHGASVA